MALVVQTAAFVYKYIYARISQIAEMTLSFHAIETKRRSWNNALHLAK